MNKFYFGRLLRHLDVFGHRVSLNYKGNETYTTVLGGVLSIIVYGLTLILAIRAMQEILMMDEPSLTEYEKPLSLSDRAELGPIRGNDYEFIFALIIEIEDLATEEETFGIPPEVGKFRIIKETNQEKGEDIEEFADFIDC